MTDDRFQRRLMQDDPYKEFNTEAGTVVAPPEPGAEVTGPAMFDLVREVKQAQLVGRELLKASSSLLNRRSVVRYASGQTDTNGNVDIPIYDVPSGFEFVTTRCIVECPAFTPATPYTNAAGWIALIRGSNFGVGSILDFLPNPPIASGAILPALFTDGADKASVLRGGEKISLHFNGGGGASVGIDLTVRLQGFTTAV